MPRTPQSSSNPGSQSTSGKSSAKDIKIEQGQGSKPGSKRQSRKPSIKEKIEKEKIEMGPIASASTSAPPKKEENIQAAIEDTQTNQDAQTHQKELEEKLFQLKNTQDQKETRESTKEEIQPEENGDISSQKTDNPNEAADFLGENDTRYTLAQRGAQYLYDGTIGFSSAMVVNGVIQQLPIAPWIANQFGGMITVGTFLTSITISKVLHAAFRNEDPFHSLRPNTAARFVDEAIKSVGSLFLVAGTVGYGVHQGVVRLEPVLRGSTNAAAQALSYSINNLTISTAVVGFGSGFLAGGIQLGYEYFKPVPKIGPEENPDLSYLQSVVYHFGLRAARDLLVWQTLKFALGSFGADSILKQPEALLFIIAIGQSLEAIRYFGHVNKPMESLALTNSSDAEYRTQGYTRVNTSSLIVTNDMKEVAEENDEIQESDLESQQKNLSPTTVQQGKGLVWQATCTLGLAMTGYFVIFGGKKIAELTGHQQDQMDEPTPAQQAAEAATFIAVAVAADRFIRDVVPPLAEQTKRLGVYVTGSLGRCVAGMWANRPSMPSLCRKSELEEDDFVPVVNKRSM